MFRTDDIIGHEPQLHLLKAWMDHPAPGYLFVGPRHLGKRLIATRFAAALLGLEELPVVHPDLILLVPEEGKAIVPVELVREARVRLAGHPLVAKRIVVFIPNFDRLNEEGMNALLKVLEEPPADAVFITVAEQVGRLPATVRSRLVALPFAPVPRTSLEAGLKAHGLSASEIERRSLEVRGRPGIALSPEVSLHADSALSFLRARSVGERLAIIEALAKICDSSDNGGDAWNDALEVWGEIFRRTLPDHPVLALTASLGVTAARSMVGGALSPRLALDAAALRLAEADPLANVFPSHLPTPFLSIIPA